jgi:hypothetical protein
LSRDILGYPVGVTLESGGAALWDTSELDTGSTDLVLAYDHSLPGDVLRIRQGGYVELGDVVGQPPGNTRLAIRANRAADNATSLIQFWHAPAATKLANYVVGFGGPGPTINHQVTVQGFGAFGRMHNAEFGTNGSLQAQNNVGIFSTDKDMLLRFTRSGTSTQRWDLKVKASDNSLSLVDQTAGVTLLAFATGSKIGLYGVTPVARQLLPTGSTPDAVITALQNIGLVRQS